MLLKHRLRRISLSSAFMERVAYLKQLVQLSAVVRFIMRLTTAKKNPVD